MAAEAYKDILKRAQHELSDADRKRLAEALINGAESAESGKPKSRSLFDVLSERGLIGAFDGPGDLSTNPKHMEGFGEPRYPADSD